MDQQSAPAVARDAWRATRDGPAAIAARQRMRLTRLVAFARRHSAFYAEAYRGLPAGVDDVCRLPAVTKPALMARFDDWVTDRAITRAAVEEFVADPGRVGDDFLGRYVVFTTSGSSGTPALLVQDSGALAVMNGLAYVRGVGRSRPACSGGRYAAASARRRSSRRAVTIWARR